MRSFRTLRGLTFATLCLWTVSALSAEPAKPVGEVFRLKIESNGVVLTESDLTLVKGGTYDAVKINRTVWLSGVPGQGFNKTLPVLIGLKWDASDFMDFYASVPGLGIATFSGNDGANTIQVPEIKTAETRQRVPLSRSGVRVIECQQPDNDRNGPLRVTLTRIGPAG